MIGTITDLSIRIDSDQLMYGFTNRQTNALIANGIITFGDLVSRSVYDLQNMKGIGKKGAREIRDYALIQGLVLKN